MAADSRCISDDLNYAPRPGRDIPKDQTGPDARRLLLGLYVRAGHICCVARNTFRLGLRGMQTQAKRNLGDALRGFGGDDAEADANNLRQATRARTLSATAPHALGSAMSASPTKL